MKTEELPAIHPDFYKYLTPSRRLRAENPFGWEHHRGGWTEVGRLIHEHLHAPDGVRFLSVVEHELAARLRENAGPLTEPWVGFMHQMPRHGLGFWDLERLMKEDIWRRSLAHCRGLWTLTDYQKQALLRLGLHVPVATVLYPVETPERVFSPQKFLASRPRRLFCMGKYLRNFQAFYDLDAPGYEKVLLKHRNFDRELETKTISLTVNDSVRAVEALPVESYDALFEDSLVYLNLLDAGAVTSVLECIVRGTPVLVNRVGGVAEYLGDDYPLYYRSHDEAAGKLADTDLLLDAARYLRDHPLKEKLTADYFLASLQNTSVYRGLPLPRSQPSAFRPADLSVVMCAYGRTHDLPEQLARFTRQDFPGRFELFVWNNNPAAAAEVDRACAAFRARLDLKVIHSSENFYCVIRMAVASLVRSDLMLICDDDVLPAPNYLSTFVEKYRRYGPRAVICARGHVFLPHEVDAERPEAFWQRREAMRFYNESQPDRQIHFMHADNCLIPTALMKRALQHEMGRYEYGLVDDYWLSYILSGRMNVPIWKVKADGALRFTAGADDPSVAMFHNRLVNEQRVNFYLHHMQLGWPSSLPPEPEPEADPVMSLSQNLNQLAQVSEDGD